MRGGRKGKNIGATRSQGKGVGACDAAEDRSAGRIRIQERGFPLLGSLRIAEFLAEVSWFLRVWSRGRER